MLTPIIQKSARIVHRSLQAVPYGDSPGIAPPREIRSRSKENVQMPHPHYTSDDIVQRGQALYEQHIRVKVEPDHNGKFLVLDIETGEYEIDVNELAAVKRAKARNPHAALYILRVGYPTAYRLGGPLKVRQP